VCEQHPQPPSRAYLISLPEDVPKRDSSLALLSGLGLRTEVIQGIRSIQVLQPRLSPCSTALLPCLQVSVPASCKCLSLQCVGA
jgi:hypothetical protein